MPQKHKTIAKQWGRQNQAWREPYDVIGLFGFDVAAAAPMLGYKTRGPWWDILSELKVRLLVSREYEHLLLCLGAREGLPEISFMQLPHPSGIAVDRKNHQVYVASTRNPNQVFTFKPACGMIARAERRKFPPSEPCQSNALVPVRAQFYPGSLYLHDLAVIGKKVYATATGHNMVVELPTEGGYKPAWWPKCAEAEGKAINQTNYIQLNSVAAGATLKDSFFSASASCRGKYSPRDREFPVDQRGVIFSGKTRMPSCQGLTRPHSARLQGGKVWVDNSGYGEFGFIDGERFLPIVKLGGWTRGLSFHQGVAFVGTSRVLPRFEHFAPGLDAKTCFCAVHAIDVKTAKVLASITWPAGNQIFAVEGVSQGMTSGFPKIFRPRLRQNDMTYLFYAFQ